MLRGFESRMLMVRPWLFSHGIESDGDVLECSVKVSSKRSLSVDVLACVRGKVITALFCDVLFAIVKNMRVQDPKILRSDQKV